MAAANSRSVGRGKSLNASATHGLIDDQIRQLQLLKNAIDVEKGTISLHGGVTTLANLTTLDGKMRNQILKLKFE